MLINCNLKNVEQKHSVKKVKTHGALNWLKRLFFHLISIIYLTYILWVINKKKLIIIFAWFTKTRSQMWPWFIRYTHLFVDWLIVAYFPVTNRSCIFRTRASSTTFKIYRNEGGVRQPGTTTSSTTYKIYRNEGGVWQPGTTTSSTTYKIYRNEGGVRQPGTTTSSTTYKIYRNEGGVRQPGTTTSSTTYTI